jgi:hypothetical protein
MSPTYKIAFCRYEELVKIVEIPERVLHFVGTRYGDEPAGINCASIGI